MNKTDARLGGGHLRQAQLHHALSRHSAVRREGGGAHGLGSERPTGFGEHPLHEAEVHGAQHRTVFGATRGVRARAEIDGELLVIDDGLEAALLQVFIRASN